MSQTTVSGSPGPRGMVLSYPFDGKFYESRDPRAPVLAPFLRPGTLVLTLPPGVPSSTIKWLSVWCRQFAVDFGHVVRPEVEQTSAGAKYPLSLLSAASAGGLCL